MPGFISLLAAFLVMLGWYCGQKRFPITDAEGTPVKGGYLRAPDRAGKPVTTVIWRDRHLFDSLMTAILSLSQLGLWILGARTPGFWLAVVFLPLSAWHFWKGVQSPSRPTPN